MSVATCSPEWRGKVAANHRNSDGIYAADAKLDYATYSDAVNVVLDEILGSPRPRPRLRLRTRPDQLSDWLHEGHYSTVFESVGDPRSAWYVEQRRKAEAHVLGIPDDAVPADRPRYGYLRGSNENASMLVNCGTVMVELDPAVVARATVLLGDSMASTTCGDDPTMAPEPLSAPGLDCRHSYTDIRRADTLSKACDPECEYAEIHLCGPLPPSDIVEVLFTRGTVAPIELRLRLDRLKIPFLELEGTPPA